MSHVCKVDLEVLDLGCLEKAANQLGLEFVRDQKTYRWYGHSFGDFPIPAGLTEADLGKCDHAIRIKGDKNTGTLRAYEVGVMKRRDGKPGYNLLWDFWAGGYGLRDRIGTDGNKLRQEYAVQVAIKHARAQGYRVSRQTKQDGSIVLKAVHS